MNRDVNLYMSAAREEVDRRLGALLPGEDEPPVNLHRAMRYSVFAGGKRLRPILVLSAAEAFGGEPDEAAYRAACALECIHTYSLIHDDLPAMDNDDLRRGKPTNHVVFGEAVAILAGDALLNMAFEILWRPGDSDGRLARAASEIAYGAGSHGMVGGQCADIEAEGKAPDASLVRFIHTRKTARLIGAALAAGSICGGAPADAVDAMRAAGLDLGLAFQITDDILDIEGTPETLGKSVGKDQDVKKATWPALVGIEESKRERVELLSKVDKELDRLLRGRSGRLCDLARLMVLRSS